MDVDKRRISGFVLLSFVGDVSFGESATSFAEALQDALEGEKGHLLLELSRVPDMDSTGLGELVDYRERCKRQGRKMILINPSLRVRRLLRTSSLEPLFPTHETVEEAVAEERGRDS